MVDETLEKRMHRAQAGDKVAYESVLKEVTPLIRSFIQKSNYKNLIDVDDLVQEVLLAIHKASHTYDSSRSFKAWVFAIANYKLKDCLRVIYRRRKVIEVEFSKVENLFFEEFNYHALQDQYSLDSMLYILKPRQQKIIRLLKIEGNSLEQAANKMNMSVAAVKTASHRACKALIKKFGRK